MMIKRSQQDSAKLMEKENEGKRDLTQSYPNRKVCGILVLGCLEGLSVLKEVRLPPS